MTWYWIVILLLISFLLGYITKDLLTIEKKIEITIKDLKVKGRGNTMNLDQQIDVEEQRTKKRWFKKKT